jgi:hypothetical protein
MSALRQFDDAMACPTPPLVRMPSQNVDISVKLWAIRPNFGLLAGQKHDV